MSVPSSCSNTRSKSVIKWYKFLINELVKQIIQYRRQNSLSSRHYVGQLCYVSLIVSQHSISHMIINWYIHMVHFLLFLHQNCSLVTGSLRKLYFKSSNGCKFYTTANIVTKFAVYVAWIFLCESFKFGEKNCYSNWDNEFFLRDCFLLAHPVDRQQKTPTSLSCSIVSRVACPPSRQWRLSTTNSWTILRLKS